MLTDTHAHLYWDSFKEDFDEMIQRAIDAGVTTIINVGVDVELSKKALDQTTGELANIPNFKVYSTIGIHPHSAVSYFPKENSPTVYSSEGSIQKDIIELEKLYQTHPEQVVAVGECGLDYVGTDEKQKDLQKKLFQAQIDLASKLKLPLIVHCRDDRSKDPNNSEAWDKILKMIGNYPAILHCYSGLLKTTQKVLRIPNVLVSFAATITYPKNEYLREAVKILPMEKIVLETDCPFLPPQSKRGQRNEPANIIEVAQLIAEIKSIPLEEVAKQTSVNAANIFAFPT